MSNYTKVLLSYLKMAFIRINAVSVTAPLLKVKANHFQCLPFERYKDKTAYKVRLRWSPHFLFTNCYDNSGFLGYFFNMAAVKLYT